MRIHYLCCAPITWIIFPFFYFYFFFSYSYSLIRYILCNVAGGWDHTKVGKHVLASAAELPEFATESCITRYFKTS